MSLLSCARSSSFRKDDQLVRGLRVSCNHDDFTAIPDGEDFEIEISYNRMIEGELFFQFGGAASCAYLPHIAAAFRGLGHVLATSRGLSTFKHPGAEDMDESDGEGEQAARPTTADIPGVENGIRWSGDVGQDLRMEESCLFETVACVYCEVFFSVLLTPILAQRDD